MTHRDRLAKLIVASDRLRLAQKAYFRTRDTNALDDARQAERDFDRVLSEVRSIDDQQKLF